MKTLKRKKFFYVTLPLFLFLLAYRVMETFVHIKMEQLKDR